MRTITETEYKVGDVSKTYRHITEGTPWYWRVAMWAALAEVSGMMLIMLSVIAIEVAKKHGWM